MSRRKRRPGGSPAPAGAERAQPGAATGADRAGGATSGRAHRGGGGESPDRERPTSRRLGIDVAVLVALFAVTAAIAELAGAANLGVALGVGQVAFGFALVVVLLRG